MSAANPSTGTSTDMDGNFTLTVPQGSQLKVSYIGFLPQTLTAEPQMRIVLKEDQ